MPCDKLARLTVNFDGNLVNSNGIMLNDFYGFMGPNIPSQIKVRFFSNTLKAFLCVLGKFKCTPDKSTTRTITSTNLRNSGLENTNGTTCYVRQI